MNQEPAFISFVKQYDFEVHYLTFVVFKGKPAAIAAQMGNVLGYSEGGLKFVASITGYWGDVLKAGVHYDVLTGEDLALFKSAVAAATAGQGVSHSERERWINKTAQLMLLYERGINLALLFTSKRAGKRLRAHIAEVILPEIARTGGYQAQPLVESSQKEIEPPVYESELGRDLRQESTIDLDQIRQAVQEAIFENSKMLGALVQEMRQFRTMVLPVKKTTLEDYGIKIQTGRTIPTTPGTEPRKIWMVSFPPNARMDVAMQNLDGVWYRPGQHWTFFYDPTARIQTALKG